jgi:hypothetical protein
MITKHDAKLFYIYNITANSMPALDYREKGRAGGFSLAVFLKVSSSP